MLKLYKSADVINTKHMDEEIIAGLKNSSVADKLEFLKTVQVDFASNMGLKFHKDAFRNLLTEWDVQGLTEIFVAEPTELLSNTVLSEQDLDISELDALVSRSVKTIAALFYMLTYSDMLDSEIDKDVVFNFLYDSDNVFSGLFLKVMQNVEL